MRLPAFPEGAAGAVAHALLTRAGTRPLVSPRATPPNASQLNAYVATLALEAGLVAEQVDFYVADVERLLDRQTPFLLVASLTNEAYAVVRGGKTVHFVAEDGGIVELPHADAKKLLLEQLARPFHEFAARIRQRIPSLGPSVAPAIASELGAVKPIAYGFVFRPNTAESASRIVASLAPGTQVLRFFGLSAFQSVLSLGGWALIGSLALSGHAERGNILGWGLLALTSVLVQVFTVRAVGRFTIRAATLVRQRLLQGALSLDPEGLGNYGLGGLMVVAGQADSFLNSVLALLLSAIGVFTNMVGAVSVLSAAPLAGLYLLIFALAVGIVIALAPRLHRLQTEQQEERMRLTTEMVERMLGHRTRLVQQTPKSWHDGEDESLLAYGTTSRRLDRLVAFLRTLPRAYYALSLAGVFVVLVAFPTHETLALSLGGLALGSITLGSLVELVVSAGSLLALWRSIQPVVREGSATLLVSRTAAGESIDHFAASEGPIVELRGVRFQYPGRSKPVFDDASVRVQLGERALVEGRSGGGKTTLAALFTGLRKPSAGLVFVRGLDQHTIGERDLRRVIAAAPQFYKNHVFTESLAFNLLLGRTWPPSREDLAEAYEVAEELGLGELLQRMPAGLFQHVGDTGWQLSHGERSRVFLARALLQRAQLLILDESFGALDPKTLQQCMHSVLQRAPSLVVITHR